MDRQEMYLSHHPLLVRSPEASRLICITSFNQHNIECLPTATLHGLLIRTSSPPIYQKSVVGNRGEASMRYILMINHIYLYILSVYSFPIHKLYVPIGLDFLFITIFLHVFCHGHLLRRSQALPCSLLHSLTMSFVVFCLQLYTPHINSFQFKIIKWNIYLK